MSNTTNLTQKDILHTQTNAEDNPNLKSSELIHREDIPNTPFKISGNEDKGYFITLGKYKLTNNYITIEQAKDAILTNQWTIIMNMIILISSETYLSMETK